MSYYNVTSELVSPIENYANDRLYIPNFVDKEIISRCANGIAAPLTILTCAVDIIIGLGTGIGALCTLGRNRPTYKFAKHHLASSKTILADPYINVRKILNPSFVLTCKHEVPSENDPFICARGDGFLSDYVKVYLEPKIENLKNSNSRIEKYIASRLTEAVLGVSLIVARVADGIIGIGAAFLSLLPFVNNQSLNNLAYRGLQAPGLISDLFECTIKCINPWAGDKPEYDIVS
jgi:hypothetical protein